MAKEKYILERVILYMMEILQMESLKEKENVYLKMVIFI